MAKIEFTKKTPAGAVVNDATAAIGGVAVADRTATNRLSNPLMTPNAPNRLPVEAESPTEMLRVQRDLEELPLAETVEPDLVVRGRVAVGHGPVTGVAAGAAGQIFAANGGDDSVSVLDAKSLVVATTVEAVYEPFAVGVARGRAYFSTQSPDFDTVSVIEDGAVVAVHRVEGTIGDLAVSPDSTRVFIGRSGIDAAEVAVLDTASGEVSAIEIAQGESAGVECVALSRDGGRLYSGTTAGDVVTVDTKIGKCVASVSIAAPIRGLAVTRDGTWVYVLSLDPRSGGLMDVIDTARQAIIATVPVGTAPTQLALSANADRAYVVDGDRILVLCTATHEILDAIDVGADISCVTESADGADLYVADFDGGVTVLSVAPTAALLARLMRDHGVEPRPVRELEPAGV